MPAQDPPPRRPSDLHNPNNRDNSSVSGGGEAGIIIGVLFFLLILAIAAYFIYTRLRARRLGIPPPPLNPFSDHNRVRGSGGGGGGGIFGGVVGWTKDTFAHLRRGREAGGAYEGTSAGGYGGSGRTRGVGFDPDEAWDARVGADADYGLEEQELGSTARGPDQTAYRGADYGRGGRSGLGGNYDGVEEEELRGDARGRAVQNPFEDPAASASLRGLSPRPEAEGRVAGKVSLDSPTERKSVFKEVV